MTQPHYAVGDLLFSDVVKGDLCIVTAVSWNERVKENEYTGLYLKQGKHDGDARFSGRTYSLCCKHYVQLCESLGLPWAPKPVLGVKKKR